MGKYTYIVKKWVVTDVLGNGKHTLFPRYMYICILCFTPIDLMK